VATLLTELYDVPPENLVTQGFGEADLKVPTMGPARENRRVDLRRLTPILQ
jgi:outer membrane protein OmpA-like peptidoglycan-associated protein